MGAPEAVPFSDKAAAEAFQIAHGGEVVRFADIPRDYVLGPVELDDQPPGQTSHSDH
jgi:copper chaperone NosL